MWYVSGGYKTVCCRPNERTGEDLDIIYSRLKNLKAFENFHPVLLQQICYYSYYENLDQGVICKFILNHFNNRIKLQDSTRKTNYRYIYLGFQKWFYVLYVNAE